MLETEIGEEIHDFIFQYNTTPHCTFNRTPAKLLNIWELKDKTSTFQDSKSKFLLAKQRDHERTA